MITVKSTKELLNNLLVDKDTTMKRVSQLDKEVSDLYHIIEFGNLNAAQSMKVVKKLKSVLAERREAKEVAAMFQSFESLTGSKVHEMTKRSEKRLRDIQKEVDQKIQQMGLVNTGKPGKEGVVG